MGHNTAVLMKLFYEETENEYIFTLTLEQTGVTLSDPTIKGWTTNNQDPGVAN